MDVGVSDYKAHRRDLRKIEQARKVHESILASGNALYPDRTRNAIELCEAMEAGYRRKLGIAPAQSRRRAEGRESL